MHNIDETVFARLKERMGQKFPILLDGYLRDAQRYLVTIQSNLDNGDLAQIIDAAHSLKSASGLLGIVHVNAEAEKLEYAAKPMVDNDDINYALLKPLYAELQTAFTAVQSDLNDRCSRMKQ